MAHLGSLPRWNLLRGRALLMSLNRPVRQRVFRIFRTLGLALGLIGGAVAAQAPEFAQQYAQRLGGAADELRRAIATLESDARASGTTRDGAVERLRTNPDGLVARRGEAAQADIAGSPASRRSSRLWPRRRAPSGGRWR